MGYEVLLTAYILQNGHMIHSHKHLVNAGMHCITAGDIVGTREGRDRDNKIYFLVAQSLYPRIEDNSK